MSVLTTRVMKTQLVITQLDLSCVRVIEDLLVMDLIVQVRRTIKKKLSLKLCTKSLILRVFVDESLFFIQLAWIVSGVNYVEYE